MKCPTFHNPPQESSAGLTNADAPEEDISDVSSYSIAKCTWHDFFFMTLNQGSYQSGKCQGKRNGHWRSWKSQGNLIWVREKRQSDSLCELLLLLCLIFTTLHLAQPAVTFSECQGKSQNFGLEVRKKSGKLKMELWYGPWFTLLMYFKSIQWEPKRKLISKSSKIISLLNFYF